MKRRYGDVVLVTGASSGIGKATAEYLSEFGYHVYGTTRKPTFFPLSPGYEGGFVKMVTMDVTDEASINSAVEKILSCEKSIDIVINCAGIGIAGAVEDSSARDAMMQMDANYFGIIRVLNELLPGMRARGRGLVVNIGSVGGIFSIPFQTLYSSSKAAVQMLTEGLRMELKPFGVKATMIAAGDTKTGFTDSRICAQGVNSNAAYREGFKRAIYQMEQDERNGVPPENVAHVIARAINRRNPPPKIVVGLQYKVLVFLKRLLPDRLVEKILRAMYSKPLPKDAQLTVK